MPLEGVVKQEEFVLTRDMVPIRFIGFEQRGVSFICPLPQGFREVIKKYSSKIQKEVERIVEEINERAKKKKPPFKNVLLGYHGRSEEDRQKLLQINFQIRDLTMSERRGAIGAHVDISAYVHLDSGAPRYYEYLTLEPLKELFEPGAAWLCYNVDSYPQALLLREFCVQYFNLLNRLLFEE
jgi:hypothetical protein